jgi:hypothetical protein
MRTCTARRANRATPPTGTVGQASPIQDGRQNVIRQVIGELRHRSKLLSARWAAGHYHTLTALGDTRRLINECGEVVSVKFAAECAVQVGLGRSR